jgi:hypothetical protein
LRIDLCTAIHHHPPRNLLLLPSDLLAEVRGIGAETAFESRVQINGAVVGDRTDGELRILGGSEFPRNDHIERGAQQVGDLCSNDNSSPGDGQHIGGRLDVL